VLDPALGWGRGANRYPVRVIRGDGFEVVEEISLIGAENNVFVA
jgi:hypothetical protein